MAEELAALKRARGTFKTRLTKLETFLEEYCESNEPIEILETKVELIQSFWPEYNKVQDGIELLDDTDDQRVMLDDRYCVVIGKARAIINSKRVKQNNQQNEQQPREARGGGQANDLKAKLPVMSLPTFDGNPEQWLQFRDSFQGLIDANDELSDFQRMYYLRSVLKGRAAEVIQSLEASAANYAIAWTLLKKRFEDKTAIASRHLQLLLDIPTMQKESGGQLRQTLDGMLRHIRALEQLGANTWDSVIVHILSAKLDGMTKREWRAHAKDQQNIQVSTLTEFLEDRCLILEPENVKAESTKSQSTTRSDKRPASQQKKTEQSSSFAAMKEEKQTIRKCAFCQEDAHQIYACDKFRALSIPKRHAAIKERKLCLNCLRANHIAVNCTSTHCKKCETKHNTLLHPEGQTAESSDSKTEGSVMLNHNHVTSPARVILSTAKLWIHTNEGTRVECRVLLDSGSQFNFIARELCRRLRLSTQKQSCSVKGLGPAIDLSESAVAVIQSKHTAYVTKRRFLITERIIERLPLAPVEIGHLKIPSNIHLADDSFNLPGRVDVILGASIFWDLLCIGQIKLGKNQPILQKTHLGWIAAGDITPDVHYTASISCVSADATLHQQVEKFWDIEEIYRPPSRSKNDELCELDFQQNHQRDETGRFQVSLPFREDPMVLGESRNNAVKRFYKIESKLEREPDLKRGYVKFMNEYVELGNMTAVNDINDEVSKKYYIPHHAVVTNANDQIKLRVVFDASAKTTSGKSLNDVLRVGPTIQPTLFATVLRFRQYQFVMTADVVKMYRQVNIREDQRDLQRIVWRPDSAEPLQEYRLNTVTYGLASAPFLAIRALQQAAYDVQATYPVASRVICRDFYVDDLLTGHDDLEELQSLKRDLIEILSSAGFELAKWNSNEPSIFSKSPDISRVLNIGEEVKTLGLSWASARDILQYRVTFRNTGERATKRTVLSIASQIFDPLGLVGPSTIKAKILLQKMWQLNLAWDESLPSSLHTEWKEYIEQLSAINDIRIPRVAVCRDPVRIELHGFSDASESAYGACTYLRSIDKEGACTIRLLCAKSKVAPLKTICVPRLELCGALLLAKLVQQVTETLSISIDDRYYWCDSTIVLAWIHGEPYTRKTFVANRITEVQQLTTREMWHYVKSEDNPADVISRGVSPNQLASLRLWWQGPEWLCAPEEHLGAETPIISGEIPETKKSIATFTQVLDAEDILQKFSSFSRLKRVIAYCLRWKEPRNPTATQGLRPLTVDELERSTEVIIRSVQAYCFSQEIHDLKAKLSVDKSSSLLTLHPFLDDKGIIRVGGRLRNAEIEYTRQHPIVLPSSHHVTHLIIREQHCRNLHLGAQALLAALQESFWILSARSTIRHVLHKCIICFRARPSPIRQIMGDLPEHRVKYTRAFMNVGVDYGGPFNLKVSRNKSCKAYICVFVCMSTKAIHVELVSDLSTPAFLNALKRFIARRGKCAHIYSDNGSNFKGARSELSAFYELVTEKSHQEATERYCADNAIQWHFIPPYSPHMGGLWEAGIKSVKTHLRKILGEALLTFEEMYTILTQIEAVLNSRPISPMSTDPLDLGALTPGHFLIGEPLNAIPQASVINTPTNRLTRFQYLTKLVQGFWSRWSREYLSNLQQRFKWNRTDRVSPIKIGMMVLLRDDQAPSMQWALGRIVATHEGQDQNVRVVSVKTMKGVVKRAVAKLCILPIDE